MPFLRYPMFMLWRVEKGRSSPIRPEIGAPSVLWLTSPTPRIDSYVARELRDEVV
jgi:hypothetical protein